MSDDVAEPPGAAHQTSPPPDDERVERGRQLFDAVYGGVMSAPPAGTMDFSDVMFGELFAEHWGRPQLDFRARRLLTLGVIAVAGDAGTWSIHLEAALRNGELTATEARECVLHLSQYAGYPKASPLLLVTEELIARADPTQSRDDPAQSASDH